MRKLINFYFKGDDKQIIKGQSLMRHGMIIKISLRQHLIKLP